MSDSGSYATGVYVKGDDEKVANSTTRAVALVFEGYQLKTEVPADDTSYRDLQAQAKELGIKANQPEDVLRKQIALKSLPGADTTVAPSDES